MGEYCVDIVHCANPSYDDTLCNVLYYHLASRIYLSYVVKELLCIRLDELLCNRGQHWRVCLLCAV